MRLTLSEMKRDQSTGPELIIKSQPIDFEISDLLGIGSSDFLVLCFDGVQFEAFGTPYDTPSNRAKQQALVDALNDGSLWPKMFSEWKSEICKQFGLPETTTENDFRPVVSCKISRVCHGYSEHLHAAIWLFETLADKIEAWSVTKKEDGRHVEIVAKNGKTITRTGDCMSRVIAEAVLDLLRSDSVCQKP